LILPWQSQSDLKILWIFNLLQADKVFALFTAALYPTKNPSRLPVASAAVGRDLFVFKAP